MLKRLKFLALGLALVLPLAACDDDDAPPDLVPPAALGNISGTALIEGAALPNATIAIAGPQAGTAITGANGSYSFTGIPVGAYTATISVGDPDITFAVSTQSVTVTQGQTATADFNGSFIRTAAIVGIVTVDTGDGAQGIALVPISVTGTESFPTQSTDTNGEFAFSGLRAGAYAVSADVSALDPNIVFAKTLENVTVLTGATVAVAFFGSLPGEATVSIASVNTLIGTAVNPAAVVNTFTVTANHDAGDDTATRLALLLNDVEVDFQTFSSTGVAGLEGPARTPGDPVTFAVNSAAFDPATFLVAFANGLYTVSVQLTTASGKVSTATLGTPLTFANLDVLTVRHLSGGKGVVTKGVR